jgi:hypothetical protein
VRKPAASRAGIRRDDRRVDDASDRILAAVDERGLLLIHDQILPSVTALIVGAPVEGSWWSHPMANTIYNALGAIESDVAVVKLIGGKNTLVAKRLWPELRDVGIGRDPWQTHRLDDDAIALLDQIDHATAPVLVDKSQVKLATLLERRLLVYPTEIHTASGRHRKAYQGWQRWGDERHLRRAQSSAEALATFEAIIAQQTDKPAAKLFPW